VCRCGAPLTRCTDAMSDVADARPPLALIKIMNPVLRRLLPTPFGRVVRPFALLEFTGRRSGRRYRVPVGWYESGGKPVVVTPAPWRANFADGLTAQVHFRGRAAEAIGTLESDPATVAGALQAMADDGFSLRRVGLKVSPGHRLVADDIVAVDRAIIRFRFD
jgi:hypothetical protein